MGKKLGDAPVYFALIQVRFNAIMTLEDYASIIQEVMRKEGFTDYKKVATRAVHIDPSQPINDIAQNVPFVQDMRYEFFDMDQASGFVLQPDSLVFQTTVYDTSETFFDSMIKGLNAVHETVSLDYIERIGIRYLDAIFPKKGKTLSDYLAKGVQGLNGVLEGDLEYAFSETVIKHDDVSTIARAITQKGKVGFPPDIRGLPLQEKFARPEGEHAILDTDSFIKERSKFDLKDIRKKMEKAQKCASNTFKKTVTKAAIKEWE